MLIVRAELDVPTFATRRLHACHHATAPSGGRWNCGQEMSGEFCLNADFHFTFMDLLHAVKLRHATDCFTSPPKEGVPTFATRRLHACHHARAPSGGRWKCGQEMSGEFCLNADFHFTFRDLLHAVKLRHGTDCFTSPRKGGVLRIFFIPKNPTRTRERG